MQDNLQYRQELQEQLSILRRRLALLEQMEPEDMESETYEQWADQHAELEDDVDDILDELDELE